jgi:hypothetical protein
MGLFVKAIPIIPLDWCAYVAPDVTGSMSPAARLCLRIK